MYLSNVFYAKLNILQVYVIKKHIVCRFKSWLLSNKKIVVKYIYEQFL